MTTLQSLHAFGSFIFPCAGGLWLLFVGLSCHAGGEETLDPERLKAVSAMLPEAPTGLGKPCSDRESWDPIAQTSAGRGAVARAQEILNKPFPDSPDELFLEFSKTGNRTNWQKVCSDRRARVNDLVLAECLENQNRFTQAFEEVVKKLCEERTWVMPAHDRELVNFKGERIDIDLASSALGWNLATADWLLGDKLQPETRKLIRENVHTRVLDPFMAMVRKERSVNWWMTGTNNWNSVCLAGVTGSALPLVASKEDRARFIVAAEDYSLYFLKGFTSDGYCSEGVGYWNYGYGHYLLLAETIKQATGKGVDLFFREGAKIPARYGWDIQILNGLCPAFADCSPTAKPSESIMRFVNRVYGFGWPEQAPMETSLSGSLFEAMLYAFPNSASETQGASTAMEAPKSRSWFDQAGILIARPGDDKLCRMGVALKGGNNAENHNHNDVGSWVVVLGERAVLTDPGSEVYTARTFSSKRYESNVLNSFGHPVPRVGGQLQRSGKDAHGEVLKTEFTDEKDVLQIEISSAYDVPELKSLVRTFTYSRKPPGSLTVKDEVVFSQPQSFGTAVMSLGELTAVSKSEVIATDSGESVRILIDSKPAPVEMKIEEIHEDCHGIPKRLGIDFTRPVTQGSVTITVTPVEK